MVNKFGDCEIGLNSNYKSVRRIEASTGKYADYAVQIRESYRVGFTPYRLHTNQHGVFATPLRCYNGSVYALDDKGALDVTAKSLEEDTSVLVYAVLGGSRGGITAIQGPPGPVGARGERGIQGTVGPPGSVGPSGARGIQGLPGPPGVQGVAGGRGPAGARGIQGLPGPPGVQGVAGQRGPAGPAGKVDYSHVVITMLKYLVAHFNITARDRAKRIVFYDEQRVKEWKDESMHASGTKTKTAVQNDPEFMARCYDEKVGMNNYLSFAHSTYFTNLVAGKNCSMIIVYRLKAPRKSQHEYFIVGDNGRTKVVFYKTIGFSGSHTSLIVSKCNGTMLEIDSFPKTNPLQRDVWHCVCVSWVTGVENGSSVWVNGKMVERFTTSSDPGLSSSVIFGGRYEFDDRHSFHGDFAYFAMFNSPMEKEELHMMQNSVCGVFKIPLDDGSYLLPG